jgi:hypothetical protein
LPPSPPIGVRNGKQFAWWLPKSVAAKSRAVIRVDRPGAAADRRLRMQVTQYSCVGTAPTSIGLLEATSDGTPSDQAVDDARPAAQRRGEANQPQGRRYVTPIGAPTCTMPPSARIPFVLDTQMKVERFAGDHPARRRQHQAMRRSADNLHRRVRQFAPARVGTQQQSYGQRRGFFDERLYGESRATQGAVAKGHGNLLARGQPLGESETNRT